jgi:alcohol dehydrogenase class IV
MQQVSFSLSRFPRIEMANGVISILPELISRYGNKVLLITGKSSFYRSQHWNKLLQQLDLLQIQYCHAVVDSEPSPTLIDNLVKDFLGQSIQLVVAIGGGSVLDAGKAISGLLPNGLSIMNFLEGVGKGGTYQGPALPFIAVPTTAGTGSEATKNAVLSHTGSDGYKKSFRDDQLIPEYALIDPQLLESCPKNLIAANGMDALTQLIESYVSTKANAFTDALVVSGLEAVRESLLLWYQSNLQSNSEEIAIARSKMAYAALLSGITLAQVGLGSVHGLAAPLGAFFPISHGVACGTLLAQATQLNIQLLNEREKGNINLEKYAHIGRILSNQVDLTSQQAHEVLIKLLVDWTELMSLRKLSDFGVGEKDIANIVANSRGNSMKTNPIYLQDSDIEKLIRSRI